MTTISVGEVPAAAETIAGPSTGVAATLPPGMSFTSEQRYCVCELASTYVAAAKQLYMVLGVRPSTICPSLSRSGASVQRVGLEVSHSVTVLCESSRHWTLYAMSERASAGTAAMIEAMRDADASTLSSSTSAVWVTVTAPGAPAVVEMGADAAEHEYFSLPLSPYTVAAKQTYDVSADKEPNETPVPSTVSSTIEDQVPSTSHAVGTDDDASRHCTA